jgi:electron transfer flavoprotein alpha subunit
MPEEIWVYIETETGRTGIKKGSLEILSHARKMADQSSHTVAAMIMGPDDKTLTETASSHGAEKIYLVPVETPKLNDQDYLVNLFASLVKQHKPSLLLLTATLLSKAIAPRLAARLDAGLITDCVELKIENGELLGRRSILYGKAHAIITCKLSAFCIATASPGAFDVQKNTRANVEIVLLSSSVTGKSRVEFLEHIKGDPSAINIKEADSIIAIGRGLEKAENMPLIRELAGLLGASIGGTRTAVDLKWLTLERQIGITGETVAPRLFISCGISGQYPHTVGMDTAETIIAINKDRDAPIFKLASLSIVGDISQIIPALSLQIKAVIEREGQP